MLVGDGGFDWVFKGGLDDREGFVGAIALFGEVGEVDVFEAGMGDFFEESCALLVGEVPLAA